MATAVAKYASQLWLSMRHSCGHDDPVGGSIGRNGCKNLVIRAEGKEKSKEAKSSGFASLLYSVFEVLLGGASLLYGGECFSCG